MDIVELIRNADSVPEVFSALSAYAESLRSVAVIPEWCLRMPIEGEADLSQRMLALIAVINLTSQNLRDRDCNIAKHALQVFAAAAWRLRPHRNWRAGP
jgi:hypothetical protein